MRKLYIISLVLFAVSILAASGCAGPDEKSGDAAMQGPELSSAVDRSDTDSSASLAFETQDMQGNTVSSDIFAGSKLTMVNVWATYCNPCLSEMPGLGELSSEFDDETFQIIGILSDVAEGSSQEEMELAADLIQQTGANYTHLLLNESLYNALLTEVTMVPTTFFIDADGTILDTVVGAREKAEWEEIIHAFLEEQ